ncbi:MAG TPA: ATP-binding protein [Thermoanaerobaculia bacterium]
MPHEPTLFAQLEAARERWQMPLRRLIDLQEEERCLIARELSDNAEQSLASVQIGLRFLQRESIIAAARVLAAQLQRAVEDLQESLYRLASNLRPATLDHLGLVAALGELVEGLSRSSTANVQFEAVGLEKTRPSRRIETELFRIGQEAVSNAIRHSHAAQIAVVLHRRGAKLRLIVEDDGIGFDLAAVHRGEHLGLAIMRERVEALGGTLLIETECGSGTSVIVEVSEQSRDSLTANGL